MVFWTARPWHPHLEGNALVISQAACSQRDLCSTFCKTWGRPLSIGYGIYAILSGIVGSIFNYYIVVRPMMNEIGAQGQNEAVAIGGAIGGIFGGCISLIYPVLLLFFMFTPRVKAAFSGQLLPEPDAGFSPPASFDNTDPNFDSNNPYDSPRSS